MMLLEEAKTMLLMHFVRIFAVQREVNNNMVRAMVLSLLPKDYKLLDHHISPCQSKDTKFKFADHLNKIVSSFNSIFIPYLNERKECIIDQGTNQPHLVSLLANLNDKGLSKIDYLLLFSLFLSLHNFIYRLNFIVDISVMESNKSIKVIRGKKAGKSQNQLPKMGVPESKLGQADFKSDDKYQYGMQQKINQKKRKYKDFFAEKKRFNENSESEKEDDGIEKEFKKFKLNSEIE